MPNIVYKNRTFKDYEEYLQFKKSYKDSEKYIVYQNIYTGELLDMNEYKKVLMTVEEIKKKCNVE